MALFPIFSQILSMSHTASLVILLVLAARLALRRAPKIFSYVLWSVVLFRLLCPVSIPVPVSVLGSLEWQTMPLSADVEQVQLSLPNTPLPAAPTPPSEEIQTVEADLPRESPPSVSLLPWLWLIGAAALLLWGLASELPFRRQLAGAVPLEKRIYLADHLDTACVTGLLFPKIYLPSHLAEQERAYILAHERHHLRRLDPVTRHLAFLALSLHWFNPLVWAAFLLSGKDMEMSCDEAVIRRLSPEVRADYASSLLSVAAGKHLLSPSPLAFGEADTRARVLNLARWRQPKPWASALSLIVCLAVLTACAAGPSQSAPSRVSFPELDVETAQLQSTQHFSSSDDSVSFQFCIDQEIVALKSASVEVMPRVITSEEMERIARVLLGDVDFYERNPSSKQVFSKSQYQTMLDRLKPYASAEAMASLVDEEYVADQLSYLKETLARIETAMASAPEENPLTPCDWKLKKERIYNDQPWEFSGRRLSEDHDWLVATAEKDGMGYTYMVVVSDRGDYKLNRFCFQLGGASVDTHLDRQIYWAQLCCTGQPTESQILTAQNKVLSLLKEMELGQWQISSTEIQTDGTGDTAQYRISIHAVPVLNGIPAIYEQDHLPQTWDDTETHVLTRADFLLSPQGDVLDMELDTPLEIRSVSPESEAPLSFPALLALAQEALSRMGADHYGLSANEIALYEERNHEPLLCEVSISQAQFGLMRSGKGENNGYCYTPTLILRCNAQYLGRDSGKVYYSNEEFGPIPLACINTFDGSVTIG